MHDDAATLSSPLVVLEAVPGAGKTTLLRRLAQRPDTLFLAYNRQLAADVAAAAAAEGDADVRCCTFHALCTQCLAPARDDAQLERAVADAERGLLTPVPLAGPPIGRLLLDEAQDVRLLYVRLLRVLGLLDACDLVVAGDERQLIYDFDPAHPASLDLLRAPERTFGRPGPWTRRRLEHTRRLTQPMVALVNALFDGADLHSDTPGPPVEVRAPKTSLFDLAAVLDDLKHEPLLLLVHRKKGNRPLRTLLNRWSAEGVSVHLHDGGGGTGDSRGKQPQGGVECGTFWSCKGLERDTVVVLLPADAPRGNPLYVALTRARRRLIVVLDPREPHADACHALASLSVSCKGATACSLLARSHPPHAARKAPPCRPASIKHVTPLLSSAAAPTTVAPPLHPLVPRLALVVAEARRTGRVRAMEDVLHPTRVDSYEAGRRAVRLGLAARPVLRFVHDDELLPPDLRQRAARAYATLLDDPGDHAAAATVTLAIVAWDDFHHIMRDGMALSWVDDHARGAVEWLWHAHLHECHDFDVPLTADPVVVRAHALHPHHGCVHVVAEEASGEDEDAAAERARLHDCGQCLLLSLGPRGAARVTGT